MLASFANMGALYEHNPYETAAEPWNTYPWVIGDDNRIILTTTTEMTSQKMIWDDINANRWQDDILGIPNASNVQIAMNATLVRFDMWGNIGSDTDTNDPDPIPDEWLVVASTVSITMTSEQTYFPPIVFDSNAESLSESTLDGNLLVATGAQVKNFTSVQTLAVFNSNAESESESTLDGNLLVATGAQVKNFTSNYTG